jgi:anthranilate synthase component 1
MSPVPPKSGEAHVTSSCLGEVADPLALFALLSGNGARDKTMLFETRGRALILEQAALQLTCREMRVEVTALTDNGRLLLPVMLGTLGERCTARHDDRLVFEFDRPASTDPRERLVESSAFDALRTILSGVLATAGNDPFGLALVGVLAFDHVDLLEELPPNEEGPLDFPDFCFWVPESLIVVERGKGRALCTAFGSDEEGEARRSLHDAGRRLERLVLRCANSGDSPALDTLLASSREDETPESKADLDDDQFAALVERLKAHIAAGDVYQIVPSRTFSVPCADPLSAFARQRRTDPSPYMFYVNMGNDVLFGASPETAVRCENKNGRRIVSVKPIAGTRPRGSNGDEDDRLEADLRLDEKEVAEHMMLVDLARNDVALVSKPGTRRVNALLGVERYARVMHLVSSVEGELGEDCDPFHALQAALNVGTLSGAPKLKATELLRLNEKTKRGPYGGAVGWIGSNGAMDTGVVIRSALVKNGIAHVRAGAGIVHDSVPLAEAQETRAKASAVLAALRSGGRP